MNTETASENTLRDVYRALFRHRRKAAAFFVFAVTAAVAATLLTPEAYLSESKLFVRLGRENATLDPTVTLGGAPVVVPPTGREDEINSVAAMLGSRAMLERVVDALGPELVLRSAGKEHASNTAPQHAAVGDSASAALLARVVESARHAILGPALAPRDQAIRHLSRELKVEPVRKSNIVTVAYDAATPELAQQVVTTLVDAYMEEHSRLNRVPGSQSFFAEQTERLANELAKLEGELADRKSSSGFASIDVQRTQVITRIGRLEDDLLETESRRTQAESTVRLLRDRLAELPSERVATTTTGANDTGTDAIRAQLFALELREREAAAIYTESHPKLQAIREELAAARGACDSEPRTRVEVTTAPDSLFEQTRLELSQEEPLLQSLTAKTATLQRQLADVRSQLRSVNTEGLHLANLEREIALREADYRKYAANLEQARIDDALEARRMSNISVVQPASFEARPIRPRGALNLALGALVGLFGAVGLAFFAEYTDRSFRSAADIERQLELPALVAIPRMKHRALNINGRN